VREARPHGGTFAAIRRMEEDPHLAAGELAQNVARAVERPVVDDDDLLGVRQALHALQDLSDARRLVVDRHDDRKLHRNVPVGSRRPSRAGWRPLWPRSPGLALRRDC
jgi:hypothetical protein